VRLIMFAASHRWCDVPTGFLMRRKDYALVALSITCVLLLGLVLQQQQVIGDLRADGNTRRASPSAQAVANTPVATRTPASPTNPPAEPTRVEAIATVAQTALPALTLAPLPAGAFQQTFDGEPSSPQPWNPPDWDITVHTRGVSSAFDAPMHAAHGSDCGAPPATHLVQDFSQAVFLCRDHMMTSLYATDYGAIYLTPNQQVDFSQGEAIIRWDVSTLRTSQRDWWDIWVTPYEDHLQLPINDVLPDGNGEPRRSLQISMDSFSGTTPFKGRIFHNHQPTGLPSIDWVGYETFLTPDAKRRDTFELRISRTHIKFGMPAYNFWWIDTPVSDLGWERGIVQLGHHSYNPEKDCDQPCAPNTWHWDNVVIAPAVPFTIIRGDQTIIRPENASVPVQFARPAPANAHLRFDGVLDQLEVSSDGGASWQPATTQTQELHVDGHFQSYWMPIPAGTQAVQFRNTTGAYPDRWMVRDVSIWAPGA
jgi:hypothetical protein